ncbi:MAG: hypothetical protein HC810_03600 [Acaryochloridaceae cyanobacterium RL_2_7]|nr:hypothetical protein [Acaryochloridaceae cyanobacterium RL_2_7]
MPSNLRCLSALCLLLGVTSCGGINRETKTPPSQQTQKSQQTTLTPEVSTTPPTTANTPTATIGQPSRETAEQAKAPNVQSSPAQPNASEQLPELSPENKKIVSNITNKVSREAGVVTKNSGLITMNRILLAQQAQWLISSSFSTNFKALESNLPQETDEYKFEITKGNKTEAIVLAIAKTDQLPSFTGASYAIPSGLPASGLCQTKLPSKTSPTPPKLNGTEMTCGNDGVLVTD